MLIRFILFSLLERKRTSEANTRRNKLEKFGSWSFPKSWRSKEFLSNESKSRESTWCNNSRKKIWQNPRNLWKTGKVDYILLRKDIINYILNLTSVYIVTLPKITFSFYLKAWLHRQNILPLQVSCHYLCSFELLIFMLYITLLPSLSKTNLRKFLSQDFM